MGEICIEHAALWTQNLERLKAFYETYFGAVAGAKYRNSSKHFESYFLSFSSGARLELMRRPSITESTNDMENPNAGYAHLAFSVGAREQVDALTARLNKDGYRVMSGPRQTGDGYYESLILDPDGNQIEITAAIP
jgi:lactoylglutathione lyase